MVKLATADGFQWRFHGWGKQGALLVSQLAWAMRMDKKSSIALAGQRRNYTKRISVEVTNGKICWPDFPLEFANEIVCRVGPVDTPGKMVLQMMRVSHIVANNSEKNGGMLVHGALAEWNGTGVILAGPGGVGKSTASKRLPSPWRALSDDTTLIVKSPDDTFWAHPWPTWSRYRQGNMSDSWDVQAAVKLKAIFMLTQKKKDRISLLSARQAISELVDVSGQSIVMLANGLEKDAFRRINLVRFHNAVAISKKVAVCRLEISRNGEFWEKVEEFLDLP